jgi:hypothetical protein
LRPANRFINGEKPLLSRSAFHNFDHAARRVFADGDADRQADQVGILWLAVSASAGASRSVFRKSRDCSMEPPSSKCVT